MSREALWSCSVVDSTRTYVPKDLWARSKLIELVLIEGS